ncbi:RagB/SusD family nutrient uptake outer membrane protein [Flexithrix dorotheae]|uniref:RagB/SusD family nutrient uptake outer membrane protein n=1 Tax=Flexithrix dorotheae TaxID=70993 RepID=UPI00035CD7DE|nr:RagB/SusD family nutrient uptake outer membrane protein [Flexithrix dorotheae]
MKSKIKSLFILLVIFNFSACNPDLVDSPPLGPTEAIYFSNANEFRAQLVGVYASYYDWYHYSAPSFNPGGFVTGTFLLPGDDLTESNGNRTEVELFDGGLNPTQNRIGFIFQACYKAISRANVTIEKVNTIDFSQFDGADEIAKMEGEALFLRGYAYYTLFNLFGSVPVITERILDKDKTNNPKSPANDVISQAITDAENAIASLPDSWDAANVGRITKNSARGLLVKALIFRANYNNDDDDDLNKAKQVYSEITRSLVPDFIDNFNSYTENNEESLFEIQAAKASSLNNLILHNDGAWRGVENMSVYRGYMMQPGGGGFNDASTKFLVTEKLMNNFGTDPRISVFSNPEDGRDGRIFQKYNLPLGVNELTPPHGGSANNERLLRYADIKLLIAEAELKTGNAAAAISQINEVRTRARAWGSESGYGDGVIPANYNIGETDENTIMQWIMDERFVELAGEGQRWDDLKRWHASGDINLTGWDGSVSNFSTNLASPVQFDVNKHLLFPIPQTEIERNSAINQNNPGY